MPYVVLMLSSSLLITPINTSKHFSLMFMFMSVYTDTSYVYMYEVICTLWWSKQISKLAVRFSKDSETHTHTVHTNPSHLAHIKRHRTIDTIRTYSVRSYILHVVFGIRKRRYILFYMCPYLGDMMIPKNSKLNGNHIMRHNIKII